MWKNHRRVSGPWSSVYLAIPQTGLSPGRPQARNGAARLQVQMPCTPAPLLPQWPPRRRRRYRRGCGCGCGCGCRAPASQSHILRLHYTSTALAAPPPSSFLVLPFLSLASAGSPSRPRAVIMPSVRLRIDGRTFRDAKQPRGPAAWHQLRSRRQVPRDSRRALPCLGQILRRR